MTVAFTYSCTGAMGASSWRCAVRMTLANVVTVAWGTFDYCASRFDDAVAYDVYYGGSQPLKPGANGVLLGDVARYKDNPRAWFATPDSGDAVDLRWYGRFTSRAEASLFLLGMKVERDMPARSVIHGAIRPLSETYTRRLKSNHG